MSLVAYDSSDESSEEEGSNCNTNITTSTDEVSVKQRNEKLSLPAPKHDADLSKDNKSDSISELINKEGSFDKIQFNKLPKPKSVTDDLDEVEEDDILPKKEVELQSEKPVKKDRAPVKITIPSLSEFKDVEDENWTKREKAIPSNKGTKLFALLPPPKGTELKKTTLIPHILNKTAGKQNHIKVDPTKTACIEDEVKKSAISKKSKSLLNYDSTSDDEEDVTVNSGSYNTKDFFALTTTETTSSTLTLQSLNNDKLLKDGSRRLDSALPSNLEKDNTMSDFSVNDSDPIIEESGGNSQKTLVSNVMNLPREEILLKNKAEVGPKLPVPEQEYNIDTEGNVAFDEKAIEYLCGKRGIKRKNKEIEEANIIEISGEDIKPDEREWLVKALTEQPVQRPVSMQGGGVNSQSKKKHQITYLAHQAKAMEMELKNQWAQNKMTRKQTQSKYGF